MGRPSKRTNENRAKILQLLAAGTTRKNAYLAVGMTGETFAQWLRAEAKFAQEVEEAEARHRASLELLANSVARGNLTVVSEKTTKFFKDGSIQSVTEKETVRPPSETMLMFLLERRSHDDYGRRDTLKLVPPEKLTDEEIKRELAAVAARVGDPSGSEEEGVDDPEERSS